MKAPPEGSTLEIDDAEIAWVCAVMGLPTNAFDPIGEDDSRRSAIRNFETMDFEACPGSGKTTLLVAKLAILANKWKTRRQGVCVLSHTNAARNEVGTRLSTCSAGSALLQYPHFIGTIHSFVNEFLAMPWLRSKGFPIKHVDTDLALKKRWDMLPFATQKYMQYKYKSDIYMYMLEYSRADFGGGSKKNLPPKTNQDIVNVSRACSAQGYFCYDEMFVWADELLDSRPDVIPFLRSRFPFVFVDEAQDNSELQSRLLWRLFSEGEKPSIRQRFGDSNQAIYGSTMQQGAQTDVFPGSTICDLPRSYRFGQLIADLARPLGITPQELVGAGPSKATIASTYTLAPTLFLFDDATVTQVLPRYGQLLIAAFSSDELANGKFFAVSGVHSTNLDPPIPRTMQHYEPNYSSTTAKQDVTLDTFSQFLSRARCNMVGNGNTHHLVDAAALATLHLAQLVDRTFEAAKRQRAHRYITELLADHEALASYRALVSLVIERRGVLTESEWQSTFCNLAFTVTKAITGKSGRPTDATAFMVWFASHGEEDDPQQSNPAVNLFSYPLDNPKVHIHLGSIHSVKGKTLTATLVLDSFYKRHHLSELKPWLLGQRSGGLTAKGKPKPEGPELLRRLKLHYVAMTRASHLLCLAMHKDSLTIDEIALLEGRGWNVVDCMR